MYSDWSHWSVCSASCGGGTQERTRKCSFPKDAKGGVDCSTLGPSLETRECNVLMCPGTLRDIAIEAQLLFKSMSLELLAETGK